VNLQLQPRSNRRSSMLRSHSSHTLGQDQPVMHPLSPQSESSFSSRSLQLEFTGQVTSPLSELQSQQSDLQDIARATYMVTPSMRRAQSTGDLQVKSSPLELDLIFRIALHLSGSLRLVESRESRRENTTSSNQKSLLETRKNES
jgi:hypothetical protein